MRASASFNRFTAKKWGLVLAATALILTPGCGSKGSGGTTAGGGSTPQIVIGEYGAMTGSQSTFGQLTDRGMQMALDEFNAKNPSLKVTKKLYDDQSQSDQARTVVTKLIDQDNPTAILGEVASKNSLAAAPVAQKAKVPMVSTASTNPNVTKTGDYIFRTCFIDPFQGAVMATFATKNLKAKTAAVFVDTSQDYCKGLAEFFEDTFTKQGGTIVIRQSYQTGAVDYKSQLTTIKNVNPDVIFLPGYYTEVGTIASQARQLGIKAPFLGGDGWDSEKLFEGAQGALEGCYFSNHYSIDSPDPRIQAFSKAYQAKYSTGVPDAMAALAYDATNVILQAIQKAGKPADGDYASDVFRAKVRDALAATKDYPGVTGDITINAERNADKPAVVLQIKGNKYAFITAIKPGDMKS